MEKTYTNSRIEASYPKAKKGPSHMVQGSGIKKTAVITSRTSQSLVKRATVLNPEKSQRKRFYDCVRPLYTQQRAKINRNTQRYHLLVYKHLVLSFKSTVESINQKLDAVTQ